MRDIAAADRGVSETLGFTLLVGLTLLGVGAIVVLGGAALDDTRQNTQTQLAEHAVSQFDAEASLVALGHTQSRRIDLGRLREGSFQIQSDTGQLTIRHLNESGSTDTIYDGALGAFVYESGQTEIAFQGGGVWRSDGNGSTMLSPPEIHYRGTTLVLPIIRVQGSGRASGQPTALVTDDRSIRTVFPNASADRQNPIRSGTIQLTVQSEYYKAWHDYFRSRTGGDVTMDHANQSVKLNLTATGVRGDFSFPPDGSSIPLRGLNDSHPITNFTMTLAPDDLDSATFSNMDWSIVAEGPGKRLEFTLDDSGGQLCSGGNPDVTLTYEGDGQTDVWTKKDAFVENGTGAFTYTCSGEPRLHLDLTDTATNLTMDGNSESIDYLFNHYLTKFDSSVDLRVQDTQKGKKGNAAGSVDETSSIGHIDYEPGQVVTFLHITENKVKVEFT